MASLIVNFLKAKERIIDLNDASDEYLIDLYKETGQKRYIKSLMKRYSGLIVSCTINFYRNDDDVIDFTQELFLKLCDKLMTQEINNFRGWLLTSIRNHHIDNVRKEQNKKKYLQYLTSREPEYDESLLLKFNYEPVHQALNRLTEQERTCIKAVYFEDKNYDEIMQSENWTFNQVRGFRDRGIKKLRKLLNQNSG